MIERELEVATADGSMTTWIFHPEHEGPHPVVMSLLDAGGVRPVLKDMASRLATAGYYVMLPNLFYRTGPYHELPADLDMDARRELVNAVTKTGVVVDATALLAVADTDPAARADKVGVIGYCMGGSLAIAIAKAFPDRVAAAASIHGGRLVTDQEDSPHLGLDSIAAELHFGWADNDPSAPKEHLDVLRAALEAAGVVYTLDFNVGAAHGYAAPGSDRYRRAASELHWERVHSLFRRRLLDRS